MKRNAIVRFYNENTGSEYIIKEVVEMHVGESYYIVTHIGLDPEEGYCYCETAIPCNTYPNYEFIA